MDLQSTGTPDSFGLSEPAGPGPEAGSERPAPGELQTRLRQARTFVEQTADEQVRLAAPAASVMR